MRIIRFLSVLLCFTVAASVLLSGCSDIEEHIAVTSDLSHEDLPPVRQPYPISFGSESFEASPETVASLSPALTDILLELGLEDRIVAVSDYCDYQKDGIERIGSPALPNIKRITELAPQLLVTQSPIASADVIKLKQAGVRVLYLRLPKSFAYLCEQYINLSLIFYGGIDSKDIAVSALSELDAFMTEAAGRDKDLGFVAVGGRVDKSLSVMPSDCLAGDMLGAFGYNLVGEGSGGLMSEDELSGLDPALVFADDSLEEDDLEDIFEDARIVFCDMSEFERPTRKLISMMNYIKSELEK